MANSSNKDIAADPTVPNRPGARSGGLGPGAILGKYRIVGTLGRGGMGVVYQAEDVFLKRHVAIKVIAGDLANDQDMVRRFIREARTAACLNHPNVVTVHEVDRQRDVCYLVMELVEGGSAQDHLTNRGAMPWQRATLVIAQTCRGLEAAHAAGLIHRDIKPSNILCSLGGLVKLGDFGLAKALGPDSLAITRIGEKIAGTPDYMSPEHCRGEILDERSDLYSLGAAYFTLLTGRTPFDHPSPQEIMLRHCSAPPPDPRDMVKEIPAACAAIVLKAMAKKPAERHVSATAMLADLDAVLETTSISGSAINLTPVAEAVPLPNTVFVSELPKAQKSGKTKLRQLAGGAVVVLVLFFLIIRPWSGGPEKSNQPIPLGKNSFPTFGIETIPPQGLTLQAGEEIDALGFSPDGSILAGGGAKVGSGLRRWNTADASPLKVQFQNRGVRTLAFSPTSRELAVALVAPAGHAFVLVWNPETEKKRELPLAGSQGHIHALGYSPDGRYLAAALSVWSPRRALVLIWSVDDGKVVHQLPADREMCSSLSFTPDGKTLFSGGKDGVIRWNWAAEKIEQSWPLHGMVSCLAALPGDRLVVGSKDGLQFLDAQSGKVLRTLRTDWPTCLALSPDGKLLAVSTWDVGLFETEAGGLLHLFRGNTKTVFALAFSPDGGMLATGSHDRTIHLWDVRPWRNPKAKVGK